MTHHKRMSERGAAVATAHFKGPTRLASWGSLTAGVLFCLLTPGTLLSQRNDPNSIRVNYTVKPCTEWLAAPTTYPKDGGQFFTGWEWMENEGSSPIRGVFAATMTNSDYQIVSSDRTKLWKDPFLVATCWDERWYNLNTHVTWFYTDFTSVVLQGWVVPVSPPKPKMELEWGGTSGTSLNIHLPAGESAPVSLNAGGSGPTEDGGPVISTYSWKKNNVALSSSVSLVSSFSSGASLSITVTDEIGGTATQSGLVDIQQVYPCDDPLTDESEDCSTNPPGGGENVSYDGSASQPGWYQGYGDGTTYVCYVTDWYQWSGSAWIYTDTTIDYCTIE